MEISFFLISFSSYFSQFLNLFSLFLCSRFPLGISFLFHFVFLIFLRLVLPQQKPYSVDVGRKIFTWKSTFQQLNVKPLKHIKKLLHWLFIYSIYGNNKSIVTYTRPVRRVYIYSGRKKVNNKCEVMYFNFIFTPVKYYFTLAS